MNGSRVLLVEDYEPIWVLLIDELESLGCLVVHAQNGQQALDLMRAARPACIVCDITLPIKDGYAVMAEMRADPLLKGNPFVAMSAHAESEYIAQVMAAGAWAYLVKPLEQDALRACLARLLPG